MIDSLGLFLALLFALCLAGCGGGGGGGNGAPSQPPTSTPQSSKPDFCYFGVGDNQIAETYDHVTCVLIADWGDWDKDQVYIQQRTIQYLQEAKARGIKKAIVANGFLTWTMKGDSKGTQYLQVFRTQLEALGLLDMVVAWYPMDEPDLAVKDGRITEAQLVDGIQRIHSVFPDIQFMTIYGDHGGYPAEGWFDHKGKDNYGHGVVTMPGGDLLVPGGADPWREDPQATLDYIKQHGGINYVISFLWVDYSEKGIRNNGTAEKWRAFGRQLKGE